MTTLTEFVRQWWTLAGHDAFRDLGCYLTPDTTVESVTLETLHGVVFANGEPMEQSEDAVRRMVRSYVGCAE